jgi:adenylate kinase family enzyme
MVGGSSALVGARRIAVYGPSGSGKSTLARRIGAALGLPVIELDALFHQPGWTPTPEDEFRAKVAGALDGHAGGWVCDGNYKMARDLVLARAEAVVWLKLPFRVVYPRLVWRTVSRAWRKEELWNTNRESWRLSFASRESILLWGITHWRAHFRGVGASIAQHGAHLPLVELRSSREVRELLADLPHPRPPSTSLRTGLSPGEGEG